MLHFLNPQILFALSAALIPLIIHLFNRRKYKQIEFSSVHFLKEMVHKEIRRLKIRQFLLLLTRMLIILFLVLSFARPTLRGTPGFISGRSASEVVILVDNSLSLNELEITGNLLENVRQRWFSIESLFQLKDRVTVIMMVNPLRLLSDREYYSPDLWTKITKEIQPTFLPGDFPAGVVKALDILQKSELSNRELFIISDFQNSEQGFSELGSLVRNVTYPVRVFLLPVFHSSPDNVSIDSVAVVERLIEKNQIITIETLVHNHQPDRFMNSMVSLIIDGSRVAQQNVNLSSSQVRAVTFETMVANTGFISGYVESENDVLMEDNRRYFNFYIPDNLSILHLIPSSDFKSFIPDILQPALDRRLFRYQRAISGEWAAIQLTDYQAVIFEGFDWIPEGLVSRLDQFYRQGKGILLIPGENLTPAGVNPLLKQTGLGQIIERQGDPQRIEESANMGRANWSHPVFQGLFQKKQELNPVQFFSYYRINPAGSAETVIALQNGDPLLVESHRELGTAFILASPLQPQWTTLVVRGLVVPLIYRILYYAAVQNTPQRMELVTGQPYRRIFSSLIPPYQFTLRRPSGFEEKITPAFRGSQVLLQVDRNEEPGNYQIWQAGKLIALYSVNHPARESVFAFYDESMVKQVFPNGIWIEQQQDAARVVERARYGKELWPIFLGIAIFLLFFEMALAFTGTRKQEELTSEPATAA